MMVQVAGQGVEHTNFTDTEKGPCGQKERGQSESRTRRDGQVDCLIHPTLKPSIAPRAPKRLHHMCEPNTDHINFSTRRYPLHRESQLASG